MRPLNATADARAESAGKSARMAILAANLPQTVQDRGKPRYNWDDWGVDEFRRLQIGLSSAN
jgi:hypothetical protein